MIPVIYASFKFLVFCENDPLTRVKICKRDGEFCRAGQSSPRHMQHPYAYVRGTGSGIELGSCFKALTSPFLNRYWLNFLGSAPAM